MKRRVDEFEFILHKTQKGSQGIEEFNKRIYDMVRHAPHEFAPLIAAS